MSKLFFVATILLALTGCNNQAADLLQSGEVMGVFGLEGRWAGPVTPLEDGCGDRTNGLMTVGRKTFSLDPFQGTTVINGTVSSDAKLEGTFSRPIGGQQTVSISFLGMAMHHEKGGTTIDGKLTSGRCSWSVNLKRA